MGVGGWVCVGTRKTGKEICWMLIHGLKISPIFGEKKLIVGKHEKIRMWTL